MRARAFLDVARRVVAGTTEADWRTATGRAYYALVLEGRTTLDRWGFKPGKNDSIHAFVRLRFFVPADADLRAVALALEKLSQRRNQADYHLATPGLFADAVTAKESILQAQGAIDLLDQIEADPNRRAAAVAAITAAFP